jgi:hypothetical protein
LVAGGWDKKSSKPWLLDYLALLPVSEHGIDLSTNIIDPLPALINEAIRIKRSLQGMNSDRLNKAQ